MAKTCRFPGCARKPHKGWTTCARHYSAGDAVKNDKRKKKRRKPVTQDNYGGEKL